jgi:signal transduction histidine kinase
MPLRWRQLTRSITARFVIVAFLVQLTVTGAILLFVQQSSQRALAAEQRALVAELRDDLLSAYRAGGEAALRRIIAARLETTQANPPVILLASAAQDPILGNLGDWPTVIPPSTEWRTIELYRTGSDQPELMGVSATTLPSGELLLAGHVITSGARLARVNTEAVTAALVIGVVLALLSALLIGRILSRQIQAVVTTARDVGAGALGRRVPLEGSGDAFDALGEAVNAMLDRIEALVSQLRMMTDGLAHDLRSPVTRIKVALERAIVETDDAAALAALERVSGEAETLLGMLSTALLISRAEAGIGRDRFVETDVAALLGDLAELYGPLAEDRGFALRVEAETGLHLSLHRELIGQALGNLIENATNYAEGGRTIVLAARREGGGVALAVADDGIGIPESRRAEALRRFGRLDPARHLTGSGLGLSLVEAVARLHGGALALEDNAPGLRAVLRF